MATTSIVGSQLRSPPTEVIKLQSWMEPVKRQGAWCAFQLPSASPGPEFAGRLPGTTQEIRGSFLFLSGFSTSPPSPVGWAASAPSK